MVPIDPRPIAGAKPLGRPMEWLDARVIEIDTRSLSFAGPSLKSVLHSRRSNRAFSEASTEEVASVVREALRTEFVGVETKFGRKLKGVVSAGALHPVKGVLLDRDGNPIFYDDVDDRFMSVGVRDVRQLEGFLKDCREVLPEAQGRWVALIADCRDLSRLYTNHQSLLWRDAGAAIQAMAMVAEALELAFCPIGILGQGLIDALLPGDAGCAVVGVVAIGRLGSIRNPAEAGQRGY